MDFEKLYNAYFMKIYSFVFMIVKNPDLAEEIAQETFFKALKTNKQFEGKASEYTWLCAIAKNTAYDVLKRHNKRDTLAEDIPSEINFLQDIENRETIFRIHEYLHSMDEPYKEVFQLRVFGELSFADIGKIFKKTESWARVTYHRARLKLQEKMQ
ncbi:MAG: RNA polymerase sigma factor [Lachnospiraceae bacterium]|nr:RNA polymerase sigma factor [Lachnospiraceae bacterium]